MNIKQDHDGSGLTYNGEHYDSILGPIHDMTTEPELRISFGWEPATLCDKCPCGHIHEVPGAERVATSVEEAIEKGWLG